MKKFYKISFHSTYKQLLGNANYTRDLALISVSDNQRIRQGDGDTKIKPNFIGTIYLGLPRDLYKFVARPKDEFLVFLGRISPSKGPDVAIQNEVF